MKTTKNTSSVATKNVELTKESAKILAPIAKGLYHAFNGTKNVPLLGYALSGSYVEVRTSFTVGGHDGGAVALPPINKNDLISYADGVTANGIVEAYAQDGVLAIAQIATSERIAEPKITDVMETLHNGGFNAKQIEAKKSGKLMQISVTARTRSAQALWAKLVAGFAFASMKNHGFALQAERVPFSNRNSALHAQRQHEAKIRKGSAKKSPTVTLNAEKPQEFAEKVQTILNNPIAKGGATQKQKDALYTSIVAMANEKSAQAVYRMLKLQFETVRKPVSTKKVATVATVSAN